MEEFVTEEEEPWYDQQDLEQGKAPSTLQHLSRPAAARYGLVSEKVIRHLKR